MQRLQGQGGVRVGAVRPERILILDPFAPLVAETHAFAPARHLTTSRSLRATPLVQRSSIPQLRAGYPPYIDRTTISLLPHLH